MYKNQFFFVPHGSPVIPEIEVPTEVSSNKEILDEIFSVDPATGLPRNDQEVFLSDKTNPLIKEFIASTLRGSSPDVKDNTFANLSDDVISELTIQHGESRVDYVERVNDFLVKERKNIMSLNNSNKVLPKDT